MLELLCREEEVAGFRLWGILHFAVADCGLDMAVGCETYAAVGECLNEVRLGGGFTSFFFCFLPLGVGAEKGLAELQQLGGNTDSDVFRDSHVQLDEPTSDSRSKC